MDWMSLIISLVAGAAGGNLVARLLKNYDMGMLWNSVAGIVGGGLGGQIIGMLGGDAMAGTGIGAIISQILAGGVGGGVLLVAASYVKKMMAKA